MTFNFDNITNSENESITINGHVIILSSPDINSICDDEFNVKIRENKIVINTKTWADGLEFFKKYFPEEKIHIVEKPYVKTSKHAQYSIITYIDQPDSKYIMEYFVEIRNDIYNINESTEYYPGIVIHKRVYKRSKE